jgi:hypothetical protein
VATRLTDARLPTVQVEAVGLLLGRTVLERELLVAR